MDRGWISLIVSLYVLLGLSVATTAERGGRLEAVLDFSTLYVLIWILVILWRVGEQLFSLSTQTGDTQEPRLTNGEEPGSSGLPNPVRTALAQAAKELAGFKSGGTAPTGSGVNAPPAAKKATKKAAKKVAKKRKAKKSAKKTAKSSTSPSE